LEPIEDSDLQSEAMVGVGMVGVGVFFGDLRIAGFAEGFGHGVVIVSVAIV
jgi:hypothetical protein